MHERWRRSHKDKCSSVMTTPCGHINERINGEFEFVKDRRRNRLGHEKANKLVSLFHNLRMLKKMKDPQYTEPTISWGDAEDEDQRNKARVTQFTPSLHFPPWFQYGGISLMAHCLTRSPRWISQDTANM